jgi:hypothetical protein
MVKKCIECYYSMPCNENAVACHRYPPAVTKVEEGTVTSHSPLVNNNYWCGEWKPLGYDKARNKMFGAIPRKESRK